MTDQKLERRRTPRFIVAPECRTRLGVSFPAQVLEISFSGVLLRSKTALAVGDRAALRATVGNRTLDVAIEIRAVSQESRTAGAARLRLGAMFVGMTAEQRVLLSELLGAEQN